MIHHDFNFFFDSEEIEVALQTLNALYKFLGIKRKLVMRRRFNDIKLLRRLKLTASVIVEGQVMYLGIIGNE